MVARNVDRCTAAACGVVLMFTPPESGLSSTLLVVAAFQALSGLVNLAPIGRRDGARSFSRQRNRRSERSRAACP
jgi:hypothetical protein